MLGFPADRRVDNPSFQESAELAAALLNAPIAAITLLDADYQWIKGEVGLHVERMPREESFCRFMQADGNPLIVGDTMVDARFSENPIVLSGPMVRSYAGAPLELSDGSVIGGVCVLDRVPREFTSRDLELLRVLAGQVVAQLQLEAMIKQQASDIKALQAVRQELGYQARHDPLTCLLNRRGLIQVLDDAMAARPDRAIAALYIDLDNFKWINDTLGHSGGDDALCSIAQRISDQVGHRGACARLGGDEFLIALFDADGEELHQLARHLLTAISAPIRTSTATVTVRASIGLANTGTSDENSEPVRCAAELIDRADLAMYAIKDVGGGHAQSWSREIGAKVETVGAHRAFVGAKLKKREVVTHFQPVVDLDTGALIRREALLRWTGSGVDDMTPQRFVQTAESAGLIEDLGVSVLQQACQAARGWMALDPGVGVSVNVSALQIEPRFIDTVTSALSSANLQPDLLTLEITESSFLEHTKSTRGVLNDLHELGVRISVDDFGTGYSSMSMLCDSPIDEVKIDRQFCNPDHPRMLHVASAAISLGHALGLEIVAEGIETEEMLDRLIDLGCESGQGFLFGKPAPLPRKTGVLV